MNIGANFIVDKIYFRSSNPYTVEFQGSLLQSRMLAYLKGCSLEIEYPLVLSDDQRVFVETKLREYFSDGIKTKKEVAAVRKNCPLIIHVEADNLKHLN